MPGEAAVARAAQRSLSGESKGIAKLWPFLGPAFIAAVAYIDPGNFATNITAGAKFGYLLLWVVLAANVMAMVVQTQSAKLGIATGLNLPEACRQRYPRATNFALWVQAEVVAMATDVAEVLGATLGLVLLFGMEPMPAALIAVAISFGILALQERGFRRLEAVIAGMVGVVVIGFAFEVIAAGPDPADVVGGLFVPSFAGTESILLASGIIGATVMPHVIYLHSSLTQTRIVGRNEDERRRILRFERVDVVIAMALAGLVNIAMLAMAAALFSGGEFGQVETIERAYDGIEQALSGGAAIIFAVALLFSGLASTSVGTMSGQVVMQGFIGRRLPIYLRRAVTVAPALVVVALGISPTDALILSQVVLSFGIPFALIPLLLLTSDRKLMGALVSPRWLVALVALIVTLIVALNVFLLARLAFG